MDRHFKVFLVAENSFQILEERTKQSHDLCTSFVAQHPTTPIDKLGSQAKAISVEIFPGEALMKFH